MLSENTRIFTKDNLDLYLKELAKEYRHLNGKNVEAEIIMVGGAAILANYGFREMTTDVDAIIHASSSMKEAINRTGDKFNLPNGWLNADFMRTVSYSPKLNLHSKHYKIFSGVLRVRIVSAEYLVAMKLKSGRDYKHDLSDIVGILAEHQKSSTPLTMQNISKAVTDLYGGWEAIPSHSKSFIEDVFKECNFEAMYAEICSKEKSDKDLVVFFERKYPGVLAQDNVHEVLEKCKKKSSLLEQIEEAKKKQSEQHSGFYSKKEKNEQDF